jgi:aspartate ammonia-lyase
MPGKINPVITEAVTQVAFQIMANDHAITLAAASGQLELNAFLPALAHNLLQSCDLLRSGATHLAELCIRGLRANEKRCQELLESSFALVTALAPYLGYEKASELVRLAVASGQTIRQVVVSQKLFSVEQLDRILSASEMTHPGVAGLREADT